jgi:hypothetical protein
LPCDEEETKQVTVGGLDVNVGLDEGLSLLDNVTQAVRRQVHAVEVGEDIAALDIFGVETELAEGPLGILVVLQIGEGYFDHAVPEALGRDFCSLGAAVDRSFPDLASVEQVVRSETRAHELVQFSYVWALVRSFF